MGGGGWGVGGVGVEEGAFTNKIKGKKKKKKKGGGGMGGGGGGGGKGGGGILS